MSLLTPLYLLATAAVTLPILFHLIRRTPRGRRVFSSLMFLTDSPPRLTRRSRLDNLLLLLLRGLALCLLAAAFARPFLRETVSLTMADARERRVAIVVDTSASMQRGQLWQQARIEVDQLLKDSEAGDDLALVTFDDRVQVVMGFETPEDQTRADSASLIRQQLAELSPGSGGTDLGAALVTAADVLTAADDARQGGAALQIVLVTDLQRGAALEALQSYEWPEEVAVSVRRVVAGNPSNASLRVMQSEGQALNDSLRVSISNSPDSLVDQFYVQWESADPTANEDDLAIYVPPGQSRIVRLPIDDEAASSGRIQLRGDDTPFDNTYHTVPIQQRPVTVGYLGNDDAEDPEGLRYYLKPALPDTARRSVKVVDPPFKESGAERPDLVVVADQLPPAELSKLTKYAEDGGHVLAVVREQESAVQLASFTADVQIAAEPSTASDYVMLGEIDFSHPVFSVFSKPQYNDFTKIHFWNHVRLDLPEDSPATVLARFDDGSPALWANPIGEGQLLVMTSGWDPAHSQLARSTKFVPLLNGILDEATGGSPNESLAIEVRERIFLPSASDAESLVRTPDGRQFTLPAGRTAFSQTDEPGLYRVQRGRQALAFAVNLPATESDTTLLDTEQLEQLGVRLGTQASQAEELSRQRQLRDIELESRQQLWRWLIVAALGILCVETLIAGRLSKSAAGGGDSSA